MGDNIIYMTQNEYRENYVIYIGDKCLKAMEAAAKTNQKYSHDDIKAIYFTCFSITF